MVQPDREKRSKNPEVQHENQRPSPQAGEPPRPATEPPGSAASQRSGKTMTDPGSGAPRPEPR